MKYVIAVVLCLLPLSGLAESTGYKVAYDGRSFQQKPASSAYLYIDGTTTRLTQKNLPLFSSWIL